MERGEEHNSSSKAVQGDYALDFADVFGGPPRRSSSMQVFRHHSFGETAASNAFTEDEERNLQRSEAVVDQFRTSWTNLEEKPVFGQEASNRQRHTRDDFYDDIFRGDEIYSSPRRSDLNPIGSPRRSDDPFASSYPHFSLSAKLTKLESTSVASGSSRSSNTESTGSTSSPWRLSSDFQTPDEIGSRARPAYKPSPLSHSKEELQLPNPIGIIAEDDGSKPLESPKENRSMFHFSLYKWAGKGSPLLVSLRGETNGSKLLSNPLSYNDNDNKKTEKDYSSSSPSSNHIIVADEDKQDYSTSSKTVPEESILSGKHGSQSDPKLNGRLHQKAQKLSKKKNSMSLRSFLDESDNIDMIKTTAARFEGERTKTGSSGENLIKNAVKGKIKGFAKIFDSAKPQNSIQGRSQSARWDRATKFRMDDDAAETAANTEKPDGKMQWASINKAKDNRNDKVLEERKTDSEKILPLNRNQSASAQTNNRKPPESVKPSHEDIDDILGDYFQVKELFEDDLEDNNQVLDSKIQQWAQGKEGNIRSLLSTLQFVLWPNSGWKPIPLVDIIEGNAVKRTYQKTLLYLHPDKLQQRGATPDQHYIARKVFNLLQEAWDHFNTVTQI